jgi:hypothetical protein
MMRIFIHSLVFRICSAPLFGVLIYLLILLINNTLADAEKIFSNQELYVCIALSYIAFESMRVVIRLTEKYSKSDISFQKRMVVQLLFSLLAALVLVGASISAYFRWVIGFSIGAGELNVFLIIFGATGLLYNILYFSHYYLLKENRERVEDEKKMREKLEADFSSFKNEINPELLYESLENLILTIHHNAEEAEEQIDYLAGIYRYGLVNRQKELISLEEELHATENLVYLLNARNQNLLSLVSEVNNASEIYLIPGSLLVTLDTIVRNTLISKKSPLQIRLYLEDDDYLVVQHGINDRLLQHVESLGAFARLQRSYTFFSEKPFVQVKAGVDNFIKFPLVYIAADHIQTKTA